jgi:hypothetical protein
MEGRMTESRSSRRAQHSRVSRTARHKDDAPERDVAPRANGDVAVGRSVASEDVIRVRAYELYLARGGAAGHELADWLAAERALRGGGAGAAPQA